MIYLNIKNKIFKTYTCFEEACAAMFVRVLLCAGEVNLTGGGVH